MLGKAINAKVKSQKAITTSIAITAPITAVIALKPLYHLIDFVPKIKELHFEP